MNKNRLKQVILDQKQEIKSILNTHIVTREVEPEIKAALDDKLIKIIAGVRRCGKSFLAHRILQENIYGYINFDDERLYGINPEDLNDLLGLLNEINPGLHHILLDEIQNIEGWELFVNRLQRSGYNLIITGSNSNLLSRELASSLTGRHFLVELYPFSFKEFLSFKKIDISDKGLYSTEEESNIKRALDDYIGSGGFPEISSITFKEQYLRDLYDKIISKDITQRYNIRYVRSLKELALYLISNFGTNITYQKLKNIFDVNSVHTIKNYISYLEEAYLVFQLYPFSYKLKQQIKARKKIYVVDTGIIGSLSFQFSKNSGKILENMVFTHLKRKGSEIYFYDYYSGEVDFVTREGRDIKELIQVCMDLENIETRDRELGSLLKASDDLNCSDLKIITYDSEEEFKIRGKKISLIPIWKWLLDS